MFVLWKCITNVTSSWREQAAPVTLHISSVCSVNSRHSWKATPILTLVWLLLVSTFFFFIICSITVFLLRPVDDVEANSAMVNVSSCSGVSSAPLQEDWAAAGGLTEELTGNTPNNGAQWLHECVCVCVCTRLKADRQVGQPVILAGPAKIIGRSFYSITASTDEFFLWIFFQST